RGDVGTELRLERRQIDAAALIGWDGVDGEAARRRGRRVGAVRRFRHQHAPACLAARVERGADAQHAAELAMRAGGRAQRHRRHAGQHLEPMRQRVDELERALHGRRRLQWVEVGEARQPRQLLVEPRIVLHGARPQRIEPGVDGVVLLRQPGEMAHHLRLAEPRQPDPPTPAQAAEPVGNRRRLGQVDAAAARLVALEKQRLLDLEAAVAPDRPGDGCLAAEGAERLAPLAHRSTSPRLRAKAAMSASVLVSVAATISSSAISLRLGQKRLAGTPASTPRCASASTTGAAGRGRRKVSSLKKVSLSSVTPGSDASRSARIAAWAWLISAKRVKPASPKSAIWMVKASAHSPELVQMLLVAFSRRICCSRVDSVSTQPRRPSTSTVWPARRPGIWRTNFSRVAKSPTCGPPNVRGLPIDWPSAATMSAPISPGDVTRPSDTASVTTTMSSAPA